MVETGRVASSAALDRWGFRCGEGGASLIRFWWVLVYTNQNAILKDVRAITTVLTTPASERYAGVGAVDATTSLTFITLAKDATLKRETEVYYRRSRAKTISFNTSTLGRELCLHSGPRLGTGPLGIRDIGIGLKTVGVDKKQIDFIDPLQEITSITKIVHLYISNRC